MVAAGSLIRAASKVGEQGERLTRSEEVLRGAPGLQVYQGGTAQQGETKFVSQARPIQLRAGVRRAEVPARPDLHGNLRGIPYPGTSTAPAHFRSRKVWLDEASRQAVLDRLAVGQRGLAEQRQPVSLRARSTNRELVSSPRCRMVPAQEWDRHSPLFTPQVQTIRYTVLPETSVSPLRAHTLHEECHTHVCLSTPWASRPNC